MMIGRLNRIARDLAEPRHITVLVDATGCGQPFVDILKQHHLGVLVTPIGITSTSTGSYSNGIERVSKKALLAAANYVMMSQSLVAEPGMAGLAELREEMESFRVHTSRSGNDGFPQRPKGRPGNGLRLSCMESPPISPHFNTMKPSRAPKQASLIR